MTSTRLQRALHRSHANERQSIMSAIGSDSKLARRRQRLADCGSHGRIYIEGDPPEVRLWVHRCGDRLCPLCARYRARQVARSIRAVLKTGGIWRHLTLTLQTFPGGSLSSALIHLRESYRKLRRCDGWQSHVRGGVYCIEVTRNKSDGRWHPHLHILYRGVFWPQREVSQAWDLATRGSPVVWINQAGDRHALYLAKYVGKPPDMCTWPGEAIIEYAHATHGTRMVQSFGNCHNVTVEDRDEHPEPAKNRFMFSLQRLLDEAVRGNPAAKALCQALCFRHDWFADFIHGLVSIPPDVFVEDRGPPKDVIDNQIDHAGKYCLFFSEPLPPKKPRAVNVAALMRTQPRPPADQTLFDLHPARNH